MKRELQSTALESSKVLKQPNPVEQLSQRKERWNPKLHHVFLLLCLLVIAAFVVMTAYSVIEMQNSTTRLVTQRIQLNMEKAEKDVMRPMQLAEEVVVSQSQALKRESENNVGQFCNDTPGFDDARHWYKTYTRLVTLIKTSQDFIQFIIKFESQQHQEWAQLKNGSYGYTPKLSICATDQDSDYYSTNYYLSRCPSSYSLTEAELVVQEPLNRSQPFGLETFFYTQRIQNMASPLGWFSGTLNNSEIDSLYIIQNVAMPLTLSTGDHWRNDFTIYQSVDLKTTAELLLSMHDTAVGVASVYDLKDDVLIATSADISVLWPNLTERDFYPSNATNNADMNGEREALRGHSEPGQYHPRLHRHVQVTQADDVVTSVERSIYSKRYEFTSDPTLKLNA